MLLTSGLSNPMVVCGKVKGVNGHFHSWSEDRVLVPIDECAGLTYGFNL